MANEDFTTYTKVDPDGKLTVTSAKVAATALPQNGTGQSYVYKDKGVGFFTGNFSHNFEIQATAHSGNSYYSYWGVSNQIADRAATTNGYDVLILFDGANYQIYFEEINSGSFYQATYQISGSTSYYCTFRRNTAVGANGTIYLDIYSDSGRTTLLTTLTLTLHAATNWRYIYGVQSNDNGNATTMTGFTQNLNLSPSAQYTLACAQISYTLALQSLVFRQSLHLTMAKISYGLSLFSTGLSHGYKLVCAQISYALSLQTLNFTKSLHLTMAKISYSLTLFSTALTRGYHLVASSISYGLTLFGTTLTRGYHLVMAKISYALTLETMATLRTIKMQFTTLYYAMTTFSLRMLINGVTTFWSNKAKNTMSAIENKAKNAMTGIENKIKNIMSWENKTKS